MERNFTTCPHCAFRGRHKTIRPAAHGTPLVSRSDAQTFHLYLEESTLHRESNNPQSEPEIYALFRYDLDPAEVRGESTLVAIPDSGEDRQRILQKLEETADLLGALLERTSAPQRSYRVERGNLVQQRTPRPPMQFAPHSSSIELQTK